MTDAEAFLHVRLERCNGFPAQPFSLSKLPMGFVPLVAELMAAFHEHQCNVMAGPDNIEGLTSLLPKYEG